MKKHYLLIPALILALSAGIAVSQSGSEGERYEYATIDGQLIDEIERLQFRSRDTIIERDSRNRSRRDMRRQFYAALGGNLRSLQDGRIEPAEYFNVLSAQGWELVETELSINYIPSASEAEGRKALKEARAVVELYIFKRRIR